MQVSIELAPRQTQIAGDRSWSSRPTSLLCKTMSVALLLRLRAERHDEPLDDRRELRRRDLVPVVLFPPAPLARAASSTSELRARAR